MVPNETREKFLSELERTGLIAYACRISGISRATVYRWRDDDKQFAKRLDKALTLGRDDWCDVAESQLLKAVKRGEMPAIRYLLDSNSDRYYKPRKARPAPPVQRFVHTMTYNIVDKRVEKEGLPEPTVLSPNPEE